MKTFNINNSSVWNWQKALNKCLISRFSVQRFVQCECLVTEPLSFLATVVLAAASRSVRTRSHCHGHSALASARYTVSSGPAAIAAQCCRRTDDPYQWAYQVARRPLPGFPPSLPPSLLFEQQRQRVKNWGLWLWLTINQVKPLH